MSFIIPEFYLVKGKESLLQTVQDEKLYAELIRPCIYKSQYHSHHHDLYQERNKILIKYIHQAYFRSEWEGASFYSTMYGDMRISEELFDKYWLIEASDELIELEKYMGPKFSENLFNFPQESEIASWLKNQLTM